MTTEQSLVVGASCCSGGPRIEFYQRGEFCRKCRTRDMVAAPLLGAMHEGTTMWDTFVRRNLHSLAMVIGWDYSQVRKCDLEQVALALASPLP